MAIMRSNLTEDKMGFRKLRTKIYNALKTWAENQQYNTASRKWQIEIVFIKPRRCDWHSHLIKSNAKFFRRLADCICINPSVELRTNHCSAAKLLSKSFSKTMLAVFTRPTTPLHPITWNIIICYEYAKKRQLWGSLFHWRNLLLGICGKWEFVGKM